MRADTVNDGLRRANQNQAALDQLVIAHGVEHRRPLAPEVVAVGHLPLPRELGIAAPQLPITLEVWQSLPPCLVVALADVHLAGEEQSRRGRVTGCRLQFRVERGIAPALVDQGIDLPERQVALRAPAD